MASGSPVPTETIVSHLTNETKQTSSNHRGDGATSKLGRPGRLFGHQLSLISPCTCMASSFVSSGTKRGSEDHLPPHLDVTSRSDRSGPAIEAVSQLTTANSVGVQ